MWSQGSSADSGVSVSLSGLDPGLVCAGDPAQSRGTGENAGPFSWVPCLRCFGSRRHPQPWLFRRELLAPLPSWLSSSPPPCPSPVVKNAQLIWVVIHIVPSAQGPGRLHRQVGLVPDSLHGSSLDPELCQQGTQLSGGDDQAAKHDKGPPWNMGHGLKGRRLGCQAGQREGGVGSS